MERFDAMVARKGNDGKTHWTRIGVAFPAKSGNGWNVYLDALPLPDSEGKCVVSLFPPKPKTGGQPIGDDIPDF